MNKRFQKYKIPSYRAWLEKISHWHLCKDEGTKVKKYYITVITIPIFAKGVKNYQINCNNFLVKRKSLK